MIKLAENKIDFEKSLSELQKIVSKLESGEYSLDESIKLFEEGMKHSENCRNALNSAKKRIIDIAELESGAIEND